MNRKTFALLLVGAGVVGLSALTSFVEARGGGGGGRGGGGGFSRGGGGGGGNFGSIRNSSGPATRDIPRPGVSDRPRPSGDIQSDRPTQFPSPADRQPGEGVGSADRRQSAQDRASRLTPEQRQQVKDRAANLTPAQKQELRQKFESSGLKPSQLPARDPGQNREDWRDWRDQNREDWQDWYDDKYDDHWDEHWHSSWWYGYPVGTVSYSFYIDDAPPCQRTVVINQPTGSATTYYFCNSVWYQPAYAAGDVKYVVSTPPAGAELATLVDADIVTVGGKEYFLSNHVFYQKITRNGQLLYVTVDAPVGAQVPSIPQYAVEIVCDGKFYYRFDRIFYKRQGDGFVVVANPGV